MPDAVAEAIAADLKAWENSIADKAKYLNHQEVVERALERRQREYNQTKDRYAEFPASAELQNKYRRRDDDERRKLEEAKGKNHQILHKVRDNLSRNIAYAVSTAAATAVAAKPLPNKDLEGQIPAVKIALNQHKDDTEKTFADLRKAVSEQKSSSAAMLAELQTQFQKQLDEHKADNASNQAQVVKAALEAQRLELSKGREESAASEAALRTEVSWLQSEFSSMRSEMAALTQKLSEAADQAKQRDQQIQELQALVSSQGEKLSNIDLMDWERVNDGMLIELPSLQATVEGLSRAQQQLAPGPAVATNAAVEMSAVDTKLGVLQTECRQMLQENEKKQEIILTHTLTRIAEWVDDLRAKDEGLQRELQEHGTSLSALKARAKAVPGSESRSASPGQRPPAPGSGAAIPADASSITAMLERITAAEKGLAYLGKRTGNTDQRLAETDQRLAKKVEALNHQTVVLEARWNNLTTKELAERVIGQLEQIYAPVKVINDIVLLNEQMQSTTAKLAEHDTSIGAIKEELAEVKTAVDEVKKAEQQQQQQTTARKSEDSVAGDQCIEVQGSPERDRAAKKRKLREPHNADRVGDEQLRRRMGAGANGRLANGH